MKKKIYVNRETEALIGTYVTEVTTDDNGAIVISGFHNCRGKAVECEYMIHDNIFLERVE